MEDRVKKKYYGVLFLIIILCLLTRYMHNENQREVIRSMEEDVMEYKDQTKPEYQKNKFENTITEEDLVGLPKGYIFLVFNYDYSNEEASDFLNKLEKVKYLGVINDVHFIQMKTNDYEELYTICKTIENEEEIVSLATVYQTMFDDSIDVVEINKLKGENVIYLQFIPSGEEANIDEFLEYARSLKGGQFLGTYQNSVFLQFNENDNLIEICNEVTYSDGYINSYVLE
jgi:hypothetical protein